MTTAPSVRPFTSALSVEEFAALRSVGYAPVGQVMGTAVYRMSRPSGGCGYRNRSDYYTFNNLGFYSPTGLAVTVEMPHRRALLTQVRSRAIDRMRQECAALGADGVVGVHLDVKRFVGRGLECIAIGTAVTAVDGRTRPARPFTSDLSGQDFTRLLLAGWRPVEFVVGLGVVIRHDDETRRFQQRSFRNQELYAPTALVGAARAAARRWLHDDARRGGGQMVVVRDMALKVRKRRCFSTRDGGRDEIAEVVILGTAIARNDAGPAQPLGPLPILPLAERARHT